MKNYNDNKLLIEKMKLSTWTRNFAVPVRRNHPNKIKEIMVCDNQIYNTKFTLEEVTKAHMGSRFIALLFL